MPCGGIRTIHPKEQELWGKGPCWVCNKDGCELFCDEWDTPLHYACLSAFLLTEEGKLVLQHEHDIVAIKLTAKEKEEMLKETESTIPDDSQFGVGA